MNPPTLVNLTKLKLSAYHNQWKKHVLLRQIRVTTHGDVILVVVRNPTTGLDVAVAASNIDLTVEVKE